MLAGYKGEASIIAGGQNMLVMLRQRRLRPRFLVTIKKLPGLDYIVESPGSLKIGALTTHRAIETSGLVRKLFPVLTGMEKELGCIQSRNWGTIGGNLCQANPANDPPPVLIALGATARVVSVRGPRTIPLDELFVDYQKTALEPDEILTEIEIPAASPGSGSAYVKETVRFADRPIASAAAMIRLGGQGAIEEARIVLQAVNGTPLRPGKAEKALAGERPDDNLFDRVARLAAAGVHPTSHLHSRVEYKKLMVQVMTRNALREALGRARA